MEESFMSYREEHNEILAKKIYEELKQMPDVCRDYVKYLESLERSYNTIYGYMHDLQTFFYFLTVYNPQINTYKDVTIQILDSLRPTDIQEYMHFLINYKDDNGEKVPDSNKKGNNAQGRARKLSSLRNFYSYLMISDITSSNPAKLVDSPRIHKKKKPRLNKEEFSELLDGAASGDALDEKKRSYAKRTNLRDYAILALLSGTGMRVSELVSIDLDDIDWKKMKVKVIRKGGSEDLISLNEELVQILQDYIQFERKSYDDSQRALFLSSRGTDHNRLTVRSVERIVEKYGKSTVALKKISPHSLRRGFGTELYKSSHDVYLVQQALGHSDIKVTAEHYIDDSESVSERISEFSSGLLSPSSYNPKKI